MPKPKKGGKPSSTTVTATLRQPSDTCAAILRKVLTVAIAATQRADTCNATVNVTSSAPSSDFDTRKTAPGVVRFFDFDTSAQLGVNAAGANFGNFSNSGNPIFCPVIDTTVKASGTGSLRFDVPSQSFPDGQWYANFSPDLSIRFGANTEFYVQWRQRFNQAFLDTFFLATDGTHQGGIKQFIVGPGDTATTKYGSCEDIHCVTQTFYQFRFPIGYNSCSGTATRGPYAGFYANTPSGDYNLENGMPSPFCLRSTALVTTEPACPVGCFGWAANEWMTFQIHIKLGARDDTALEFVNSWYQMWVARENQPSQLVIDWQPGVLGYFQLAAGTATEDQRFGKVWLLPYMTNKDPTQVHPLCQTWYDELIISTQRIADPVSTSTFPTWRAGKTKDTLYSISGTQNMSNIVLPSPSNESPPYSGLIDAWGGFASNDPVVYSSLSGGHATSVDVDWQNAGLRIDLSQNVPAWAIVDQGSVYANAYITQRYLDGRPCSRHIYYNGTFVPGMFTYDGKDRLFHVQASFAWATAAGPGWPGWGTVQAYGGGPEVEAYRLADSAQGSAAWDAAGYWTPYPGFYASDWPSVVTDVRSGKTYVADGTQCYVFDASVAHGSWTTLTPSGMEYWGLCAITIDTANNQLVALLPSRRTIDQTPKLQRMSLSSPYTITNTVLTGYSGFAAGMNFDSAAMVYDVGNNRFLAVRSNAESNSTIDPPLLAIAQNGACTELTNAVIPRCRGSNSPLSRMVYLSSLKCVVYASTFSNQLHFIPTS